MRVEGRLIRVSSLFNERIRVFFLKQYHVQVSCINVRVYVDGVDVLRSCQEILKSALIDLLGHFELIRSKNIVC